MKDSTKKKLKLYTCISAVAATAITPRAEAVIEYSGLKDLTVNSSSTPVELDLNNDGQTDFRFVYTTWAWGVMMYIERNEWINHRTDNNPWVLFMPQRLTSGYQIGPVLNNESLQWGAFFHRNNSLYVGTLASSNTNPEYPDKVGDFTGQRGYLGVRFTSASCNNGNFHYGWIQFEAQADARQGRVIDWAYETDCNKTITAGDRGQNVFAVPALDRWGGLAMAALLAATAAFSIRMRKQGRPG